MRISVIGVPQDLGAEQRGADSGPSAIRFAGLGKRLKGLGHEVFDLGNLVVPTRETAEVGNRRMKYVEPICSTASDLMSRITQLDDDCIPLVLGGDHSLGLGSVAATVQRHGDIGLLWIDAHGDFNTSDTTLTGNIHGQVLAALAGLGDRRLTGIGSISQKVPPNRIVILGARDFDPDEQVLLREQGVHVFSMSAIETRGLVTVTEEALALATLGHLPLHVSFDIDVIDPLLAPGTGSAVSGGLTGREAMLVMGMIFQTKLMQALDLVEVNSMLDKSNMTGQLAVDLICAAFSDPYARVYTIHGLSQ